MTPLHAPIAPNSATRLGLNLPEREEDLSNCPYFRHVRLGDEYAVCHSGCWTEPACFTDEPTEGWPSMRRRFPDNPTTVQRERTS